MDDMTSQEIIVTQMDAASLDEQSVQVIQPECKADPNDSFCSGEGLR
jgi:hypothetical protein